MRIDIRNVFNEKPKSLKSIIEGENADRKAESEAAETSAEPGETSIEAGETSAEAEEEEIVEAEPENNDSADQEEKADIEEDDADYEEDEPEAETVEAEPENSDSADQEEIADPEEDDADYEEDEPEAETAEAESREEATDEESEADEGESSNAEAEEVSAEAEEIPDEAAEASAEPEEISAETVETSEEDSGASTKAKRSRIDPAMLWRKYGSIAIIAAAFVVLLAFMVVYTTMIPREVHAIIDGQEKKVVTTEYTVEGFLREQGVSCCEEDSLSVPPEGFISDGMTLELVHAVDFKVTADGRTVKCKSLEETVGKALEDAGIKVRKRDIVTPEKNSPLEADMEIVVQRVETEKVTVKEKVPFEVITQHDNTMNEGETKVLIEGEDGKDRVTYEVTYIDGKEASRKELKRKVLKPVVDEVVANGTRILYNGRSYSRKLVVKAYSYTGGGITAMGTRARVGEIAVDPRIIPLGTNVYIEGVGARRAEDTGGNIKGNTIDIYMDTHAECIRWGVRYVTIYIE